MRPDDRRALDALVQKYSATVPRAPTARNVNQLVDLAVQQKLYESPKKSYSAALRELFDEDPELKELYARSP